MPVVKSNPYSPVKMNTLKKHKGTRSIDAKSEFTIRKEPKEIKVPV